MATVNVVILMNHTDSTGVQRSLGQTIAVDNTTAAYTASIATGQYGLATGFGSIASAVNGLNTVETAANITALTAAATALTSVTKTLKEGLISGSPNTLKIDAIQRP